MKATKKQIRMLTVNFSHYIAAIKTGAIVQAKDYVPAD